MALPKFDVLCPDSLDEACDMLESHASEGIKILAGGTDLLVNIKLPVIAPRAYVLESSTSQLVSTHSEELWKDHSGPLAPPSPAYLLSLHRLRNELERIEELPDGSLLVGALTTARTLQMSELVRLKWAALAEGADALGSPLVRARGTLGGNICNARPAADLFVPSVALGAKLGVVSIHGYEVIDASEFALAPGKTRLQSGQILVEIVYPASPPGTGSAYYKLAQRKALDISVVGAGVRLTIDSLLKITSVSLALGAVGPTPIVAKTVIDVLLGKKLDDSTLKLAATAAASDATPIDDHRGSALYRKQMIEVLTRKILTTAYLRARRSL
ncbi:xanthine dehydrogenase family protein subunit M [bacterium]|nr:xanthine dehydrogenase family protein subunit M [bacterium]